MVELTALSSRIGRSNALVNFYVSHVHRLCTPTDVVEGHNIMWPTVCWSHMHVTSVEMWAITMLLVA